MQKQTQNYILLIMNCVRYTDKAELQKTNWLQKLPSFLIYYHVVGLPLLETEFLFSEKERILYVRVADDYNSLPQKVIAAYEAINTCYDFKYIFKTDDDQQVSNTRFFEMIKRLIKREPCRSIPHYGGHIIDVRKPYLSEYHKIHPELPVDLPILATKYCSGRFYFLSFSAINSLIKKKKAFVTEYLEDYAIGFHLDDFWKEDMLHIQTDRYLTDFK